MLTAKIVSAKEIGHGITKPIRLEMKLGEVVHSSKVQISRSSGRSSRSLTS